MAQIKLDFDQETMHGTDGRSGYCTLKGGLYSYMVAFLLKKKK